MYDSEIISLNTVTEDMKTIIGSLEACKNLSNENNTKDNSINEQKEKE